MIDIANRLHCRFCTLTLRSSDESLRDLIDKLYRSFSLLRRSDLWTHAVDGGVAFLEVKWSEQAKRWHPHIHMLLQGRYMDVRKLSSTWHRITGDSYIVDIRRPKNTDDVLRYVVKYAGKPISNTFANRPALLDEAVLALKYRNLAMTFGKWRGCTLTKLVDGTDWLNVGTLADVIADAVSGDLRARGILKSLRSDSADEVLARPPPPQPESHSPPHVDAQSSWDQHWLDAGAYRNDLTY